MKHQAGFSIIELIIVVAIVGILAAIAIPLYQNEVVKSERSEAMVILKHVHVNQTSYYSTYDTYLIGPSGPINQDFGLPMWSTAKGYDFSLTYWPVPATLPPWNGPHQGYFLGLFKNIDNDPPQDTIIVQVDPANPGENGIPIITLDDITI